MSYAKDLDVIARTLAVLAVHGARELTENDFDVALVARGSVLELATTVQFDLTGLRGQLQGTLRALESHPAASFARALVDYPVIRSRTAPSDALGQVAETDAGAEWQRVGRHALSATQHWAAAGYRPADEVAWVGLADIAAICAVMAELDSDLAHCAEQFTGREGESAELLHASTSGLRIAARHVSELAHSGPLSDRGPEPRARDNRGLVTITAPGDIAVAHQQFVSLLSTADHIRPERLTLFAVGHLRTCRAFLQACPSTESELEAAFAGHVELLAEVTRHTLPAASLDPGDTHTLRQAQVIRHACRQGSALLREVAVDPAGRVVLASALADTTVALQQVLERQVTSGAWVLVDPHALELRWERPRGWASPPAYVQALRTASMRASRVSDLASGRTATSTVAASPRSPSRARDLLRPAPHRPLSSWRVPPRPLRPSLPTSQHFR